MTISLFARFPKLVALPRAELCDLPTPVEAYAGLLPRDKEAEQGRPPCEVWVKRDGLTNGAYGGNKPRKLEFLLGAALAQKRRAVITFGAYGSNHALATAVHASALGLEPHVVLSPQPPGPFAAVTLRAHAALGTHIHLTNGWDGRRDAVRVKRELQARDGIEPFVIPMGGTNALGAVGYVNAAFEIVAQAEKIVLAEKTGHGLAGIESGDFVVPSVVYVAGGTLGTAVGLAVGFAALERLEQGASTRVVAVRVTPYEIANEPFAEKLAAGIVELLRTVDPEFPDLSFNDLRFDLRHDFFEPGYGVPTPESSEAVTLAKACNLELETTYTGKALAALMADARDGRLDPTRDRVLFWDTYHSGPMPAPGSVEVLPEPLQEYIAECDRLFGTGHIVATPSQENGI